jgi:hypothetical protein
MNRSKNYLETISIIILITSILITISITLYECYGYEHYNRQIFPDTINGHYDPRFFKKKLTMSELHKKLYELLTKFKSFYKGEFWLAYGTLIGGVRHNKIIPWDDDIDLHTWAKDLTQLKNPNWETNDMIWKIIPNADKPEVDEFNGIDARLICKKTGLFIDIMAYHKKLNKKSYFIKHEILSGDKNNDINLQIKPFKQVKFNDKYYNVSHDYLKDLYRYYGKNVLTHDHKGKKLDLPPVESPT